MSYFQKIIKILKRDKQTLPRLILVDSTEKCAGTSIKHILRNNFAEKNFFDLDNGDPPSESIRNYGIKCDINFPQFMHKLKKDQSNFYEIYNRYINKRADWLLKNLKHHHDIQCIYGNGIMNTKLKKKLEKKYSIFYVKFFREPAERVAAEYFYVLKHKDHNLHKIAAECKDLNEYAKHDLRPKNRQSYSVFGNVSNTEINDLKQKVEKEYGFIGFLDTFQKDINVLSKILNFKRIKNVRRNQTRKTKKERKLSDKFISLIKQNDEKDYLLYYLLKNK